MGHMSRQASLLDKLDFLRMQLDIARENEYEFMQKRIEREMALVSRELVEGRESKPPDAESKLEDYR